MAATASDSMVSINASVAGARFMPPEELAMQSLTKQLYKSRLFRGHYLGRCYVEQLSGYRDVVALQRSERELEKLLLSSASKLQLFYQRFVPNMFVGITKGSVGSYKHEPQPTQLDTCIWAELNNLAFGEYWFSIKTLRFRDQEVQLKLKMVRAVEPEVQAMPRRSVSQTSRQSIAPNAADSVATTGEVAQLQNPAEVSTLDQPQIGLAEFVAVLEQWVASTKQTVYDFMANDVNKRNLISTVRFLGLLIFSALSGAVVALRFLGIFALRFLFELSRFTHTATPIVFKLIEFINKIVGAFFILLTMIWKDLVVNRGGSGAAGAPKRALEPGERFRSITYDSAATTAPHGRTSRYASPNFL